MDLDFSKFIDLPPDKFIKGERPFEFVTKFENSNTEISVLSYVKLEDGIYKLIIKGNYESGHSLFFKYDNEGQFY